MKENLCQKKVWELTESSGFFFFFLVCRNRRVNLYSLCCLLCKKKRKRRIRKIVHLFVRVFILFTSDVFRRCDVREDLMFTNRRVFGHTNFNMYVWLGLLLHRKMTGHWRIVKGDFNHCKGLHIFLYKTVITL